jgi:hypothetical protein
MITVREFSVSGVVEILGDAPPLPPNLAREVERIWQARGGTPFNGRILSAVEIAPDRIAATLVEYRWFVAQRMKPDLFPALQVRPVAVSGVLHCADGIVIGRRSQSMMQDPGLWELVPSGGMDGTADIRGQILAELREEVGLTPDQVDEVVPFCLIEDDESHTLDIGIALAAPRLGADAVLRAWRDCATREYTDLKVTADFIEGLQVAPVSRALWRERLRQPWQPRHPSSPERSAG